jgi:hypothetical protein
MEYRRSYKDETADQYLVDRHEREIFPLMKKRYLFSGSAEFRLYDFFNDGAVNENVFAYTNRAGTECALVLYNNSFSRASGWIKDSSVAKDGVRNSLCGALGLSGESDCFLLVRELQSSLWYIRSSKEIGEKGLFADLNGYGTQVFLDLHEVKDDEYGSWARLHHDLAGRGVREPAEAKMDLILGELYYRFDELFKLRFPENAPSEDTNPGANTNPDELKPLALAFIETARKYINGAGVCDAWAGPAKKEPHLVVFHTPETVWEDFRKYLERLKEIAESKPDSKPGTGGKAESTRRPDGNEPETVPDTNFGFAYAVLGLLKPIIGEGASGAEVVSLAEYWQLDRKLREKLGADDKTVRQAVDIMKAVLVRTDTKPLSAQQRTGSTRRPARKKSAKALARSIILDNYADDDFRSILGINVFDDITWFNKEAFEQVLVYAPLFAAIESGEFTLVDKVRGELKRAGAKSGYNLSKFIEALTPVKRTKAAQSAPK